MKRDAVWTFRERHLERSRGEAERRGRPVMVTSDRIRDLVDRARRSRWQIAAALPLVAVLATLLMAVFTSPSYTAKVSLLVAFGREYMFRPMVGASESILPWRPETVINSELEILNSDDLKRQIVSVVGPTRLTTSGSDLVRGSKAEAKEIVKAVEIVRQGLALKGVKDSNVIHAYFRHSDAEVAALVLEQLVTGYLQRRGEIYGTETVKFMQQVLTGREQALVSAQRSLQEYKRNNGLVRFEDERLTLQQREVALLGERDTLQRTLVEAKGERRVIEPLRGVDNAALPQIEARIGGANAALSEVDSLISGVRSRLEEIEAHKSALERLAAAVAAEAKNVEESRTRLEEARLNEALDGSKISNVKVLQAPIRPERKDGLSLTSRLGVALIIGLLGAAGVLLVSSRIGATPTEGDAPEPRDGPKIV
jgi:uncharacterized protein involved in exopolysaccharide biosynthesis